MTGSVRLGLMIVAGVIVAYIALKVIMGVMLGLLGLLMPLAIVAGVALVIYGLVSRKALGGGRRYLP